MKDESVSFEKQEIRAADYWKNAQPIEGRNPQDEINRLKMEAIRKARGESK